MISKIVDCKAIRIYITPLKSFHCTAAVIKSLSTQKAGNHDNNNSFAVSQFSWLRHTLRCCPGPQGSLGNECCLSPPHPADPISAPLSSISCKHRFPFLGPPGNELRKSAPETIWTGPDRTAPTRYDGNITQSSEIIFLQYSSHI